MRNSREVGSLYVSASEIELFDLCPRKWAFVYVENKRPPPNDSAALGTRVHAILEKWLKDGTAPDTWTPEGEIAASGLHLLPAPKIPTLVTEEQFHFTSQRAWYTGFKDFRYRDADGLLHVGDHKTTKSFTWAKTTDEILCHSQALIYAVDEFHKNPGDNRLALDWVYYKTTGSRKAEPRFQIVSKDTVAEMFFEHVDPVAGEITRLHHEVPPSASALEFVPDFRACDAFGGCAFLSICNPTPTQRVQATMTQAGMSLTDKLKAMKAGRAPSPIHPPEHAAIPEAMRGLPMLPPVAAATPYAPPAPPTAPYVPSFSLPTPGVEAAPPAVATPQAALQGPPAVPFNSMPVPAATPPAGAPAEAPKKRGRPPKATSTVAATDEALAALDGFTLYIGCAPVGAKVTNALIYVNAAHDEVRKTYGVAHHREMEYGKGPGELCKALEALFALCEGTENMPSGDVFLGNTQIEEDTAPVWISKAAKVVRAFR